MILYSTKGSANRSLLKKLHSYSTVLLVTFALCSLTIFSFINFRFQASDRARNLDALSTVLARLVARPLSLGDYLLVEDSLRGAMLPDYVRSVSVYSADGSLIAKASGDNDSAKCGALVHLIKQIEPSAAENKGSGDYNLNLEISNCDIRRTAAGIALSYLALGSIMYVALFFLNRFVIKKVFQPLYKTVEEALAGNADVGKILSEQAPEEIAPLLRRIAILNRRASETEAEARLGKLAAQVAHDIRSPLSALNILQKDLNAFPEEKRLLLRSAISRIQDIANELLRSFRSQQPDRAVSIVSLLSSTLEEIFSEKRLIYRPRLDVRLNLTVEPSSYGAFVDLNTAEFGRVLSNLINNAVEALPHGGHVNGVLRRDGQFATFLLSDDGMGMSADFVKQLNLGNALSGKTGGSGLGFSHAKRTIEKFNGRLLIESQSTRGTEVTIQLPCAPTPSWFLQKLSLQGIKTLVVVDDDESVHLSWNRRLADIGSADELEVVHFAAPDQVPDFNEQLANDSIRFLFDLEFSESGLDGLDHIAKLGISKHAILVTSHHQNSIIQERSQAIGVKILPKALIGQISICRSSPNAI